jgi:starvation-inducible DNA-binding protein
MFEVPPPLPEEARRRIAESLNLSLADGLDLESQLKAAHWNLQGVRFPARHLLFDTYAAAITAHNDTIAERAVTLGGRAYGTARHVAQASRLSEYPEEPLPDVEHATLVADRVETYLRGVLDSRTVAGRHGDAATVDVLTRVVREFERHAWMLRATREA